MRSSVTAAKALSAGSGLGSLGVSSRTAALLAMFRVKMEVNYRVGTIEWAGMEHSIPDRRYWCQKPFDAVDFEGEAGLRLIDWTAGGGRGGGGEII
jgi:hypothetical protein